MKTKTVPASDAVKAFRTDCIAVLVKHAGALPADQMLAMAAHLVGQILAMQDQRTVTPAMGLALIGDNIETGNREALAEVSSAAGGAS
jgi:hypothetical protein